MIKIKTLFTDGPNSYRSDNHWRIATNEGEVVVLNMSSRVEVPDEENERKLKYYLTQLYSHEQGSEQSIYGFSSVRDVVYFIFGNGFSGRVSHFVCNRYKSSIVEEFVFYKGRFHNGNGPSYIRIDDAYVRAMKATSGFSVFYQFSLEGEHVFDCRSRIFGKDYHIELWDYKIFLNKDDLKTYHELVKEYKIKDRQNKINII